MSTYFQASIYHNFENIFESHHLWDEWVYQLCFIMTKSSLRYECIHLDTNILVICHCLLLLTYMLWYRIFYHCKVKDLLCIFEGLGIYSCPSFLLKKFLPLLIIILKCKWFLGLCLKIIQALLSNNSYHLECSY